MSSYSKSNGGKDCAAVFLLKLKLITSPSESEATIKDMNRIVYVNGDYVAEDEAKISIFDRGFLFADGVYEVTSVLGGKLIDFQGHARRLLRSLSALQMENPISDKELLTVHRELIDRNNIVEGLVYLQITRGVQPREHAYKKNLKPNIIIYTARKNFNLPNKNYKGFKAITYPDIRWGRPDIKTTSLLANILAATYASNVGAYESIFFKGNKITEAAHSNVWIIKKKKNYNSSC